VQKTINDGFMYVCVAEKCEMIGFCFSANITLQRGVIQDQARSAQKNFQNTRKNFQIFHAL